MCKGRALDGYKRLCRRSENSKCIVYYTAKQKTATRMSSRAQKAIKKLFQDPQVLRQMTTEKTKELVQLLTKDNQKAPALLDLQDVLLDIYCLFQEQPESIMKDLETQSSDESSTLSEQLTEALNLYLPSLEREAELNLKEFLVSMKEDAQRHCSNGSSSTETTSTLCTTAPTVMDRAGASISSLLRDELEELYLASPSVNKTISYSSNITLKLGESAKVYQSETQTTQDYFLDLKVYDLRKVAPSNLGTKEMWKDAIIRMKVYGNNLFEGHLMNMARNLSTEAIKVVQKRNEEDVEEPEPKPKKRRSNK